MTRFFADTFYWIVLINNKDSFHDAVLAYSGTMSVAMRRAGLTDVLTGDRHFEQEGFRALVRS